MRMATRRIPLINNEIYHIIIRGVSDSLIFKNDKDRYRAIFSLYEFNNRKHVDIRAKREEQRRKKKTKVRPSEIYKNIPRENERDLLVDILAFCFMPNHVHLLLRQIRDGGISMFMRKFGTGYASYFNKKYKRQGYLLQGRFKSVHIKTNNQLKAIFSYIHTNPVALIEFNWKENEIRNYRNVIKFLENYRWSSYLDYIGKENFPSVTKRKFLIETMGGKRGCISFVNDWLKHKTKTKEFSDILIE